MNRSQELHLFCIKHRLEFPTINVKQTIDENYTCNIIWYNQCVVSFHSYNGKENAIIYSLIELDNWLKSEINFIELITLDKNKKGKKICF